MMGQKRLQALTRVKHLMIDLRTLNDIVPLEDKRLPTVQFGKRTERHMEARNGRGGQVQKIGSEIEVGSR